jgi:hypothetical protein
VGTLLGYSRVSSAGQDASLQDDALSAGDGTYFQPLAPVLQTYGLRLRTSWRAWDAPVPAMRDLMGI